MVSFSGVNLSAGDLNDLGNDVIDIKLETNLYPFVAYIWFFLFNTNDEDARGSVGISHYSNCKLDAVTTSSFTRRICKHEIGVPSVQTTDMRCLLMRTWDKWDVIRSGPKLRSRISLSVAPPVLVFGFC